MKLMNTTISGFVTVSMLSIHRHNLRQLYIKKEHKYEICIDIFTFNVYIIAQSIPSNMVFFPRLIQQE